MVMVVTVSFPLQKFISYAKDLNCSELKVNHKGYNYVTCVIEGSRWLCLENNPDEPTETILNILKDFRDSYEIWINKRWKAMIREERKELKKLEIAVDQLICLNK